MTLAATYACCDLQLTETLLFDDTVPTSEAETACQKWGGSAFMKCMGVIFYYYWRAGASQPSRTAGTIFLYIYMYPTMHFGPTYKLCIAYGTREAQGTARAMRKRKAGSLNVQRSQSMTFHDYACQGC